MLACVQKRADDAAQAVSLSANESLLEQWNGVVNLAGGANSQAAQEMQRLGAMLDVMSAVSYAIDHYQTADALVERLPAGTLTRAGYGQLEDSNGLAAPEKIDLQTLLTSIEMDMDELDTAALGANPLMALMQAWMDAGVDPSQLDTSAMDETLAAAMHVLMAKQDAESLGTDAMESLTQGVAAGCEEALPHFEQQGARLGSALALGNQAAKGQTAVNQIRAGLIAGTPDALLAARSLAARLQAELTIAMPGLGQGAYTSTGGVVSNSTDNSVNVTIEHASLESEGQAGTLADQIAAYSRMKNAGVGED